jgi:release factor glutamine methyltransferase
MDDAELATIKSLVKRAIEQEPIQYLTGKAHFYNLEFEVNRDVLIPRPDTETLVDRALAYLKASTNPSPRVLDLCTGSGCVAAAIAAHHKASSVVATDISLPAIDVARRNIERNKLAERVTFHVGDLYDALKDLVDARPFDLIVSNPPYIASEKIKGLDANVRDYEPHLALDGGPDGLDPHRRILAGAYDRLVPGGGLLMEIAFDQEEAAMWMLSQEPRFTDAKCFRDLAGQPRVISAKRV